MQGLEVIEQSGLLTEKEVSNLLKIPVSSIQKWRLPGKRRIKYYKIGHLVRYRSQDVWEYIDKYLVANTEEKSDNF